MVPTGPIITIFCGIHLLACRLCNVVPEYCPHRNHYYVTEGLADVASATNACVSLPLLLDRDRGLTSLSFPDSFPPDAMHTLFENVAVQLWEMWTGKFKYPEVDEEAWPGPFILDAAAIRGIGTDMEDFACSVPSIFGRKPRNIAQYGTSFVAEEWIHWVTIYSEPLLARRLLPEALEGWMHFVKAVRGVMSWSINRGHLEEIRSHFIAFHSHFKSHYAPDDDTICAMRINIHILLHFADTIEKLGPSVCWWQFPIERYCGMVAGMLKSRVRPYENIARNMLLLEQVHHVRFMPGFEPILDVMETPSRRRTKTAPDRDEVFLGSFKPYRTGLPNNIRNKVRHHYVTLGYPLQSMNEGSFIKCGRMDRKGVVFGSKEQYENRAADNGRVNYTVALSVQVDRNERLRNAEVDPIAIELYGEVLFYLFHEHPETPRMMAFVAWADRRLMTENYLHTVAVRSLDSERSFIDVICIDRHVAFLHLNSRYYVGDDCYFGLIEDDDDDG